MKKIMIIVMAFIATSAFCQTDEHQHSLGDVIKQNKQNRHEFSVYGAGGVSTLLYTPLDMGQGFEHKLFGGDRLAFQGGFEYAYQVFYNWGAYGGVEYAMLRDGIKFPLLGDTYYTTSDQGKIYLKMNYEGADISQRHTLGYINIPFGVKFQTNELWKGIKFYSKVGAKVWIPLSAKYSTNGSITSSAFDVTSVGKQVTYDPYMGKHGLGPTLYDWEEAKNVDFEANFSINAEVGMKFRLKMDESMFLYVGFYVDYGLSDIHEGGINKLFTYNEADVHGATASIFNSRNGMDMNSGKYSGEAYTESVHSLLAGIKVQFTFGKKLFTMPSKVDPNKDMLTAPKAEKIVADNVERVIDFQKEAFKDLKPIPPEPAKEPDFIYTITGFDFNKSNLQPFMVPLLDDIIKLLHEYPDVRLRLIGHADNIGSEEYNDKLGLERAESVREYFVLRGIPESRFEISSFSNTRPILPNDDDPKRRLNRRVDIEPIK